MAAKAEVAMLLLRFVYITSVTNTPPPEKIAWRNALAVRKLVSSIAAGEGIRKDCEREEVISPTAKPNMMSDKAEATHGTPVVCGGIVHANHHSPVGRARAARARARGLYLYTEL